MISAEIWIEGPYIIPFASVLMAIRRTNDIQIILIAETMYGITVVGKERADEFVHALITYHETRRVL